MKIYKSIRNILKESYRWRNRELIEKKDFVEPVLTKSKFFKSNILLFTFCIVISLVPIYLFTKDFSGYIINALAIFFGLLTSILILIFEKYLNQKDKFTQIKNPTSIQEINSKKIQNFSRQFVFISLESLLIAITLIILLLLPLSLNEYFSSINVLNYSFKLRNINYINILYSIEFIFILLIKSFILLFLFKFLKYLIYIIGSLGNFLLGTFRNHLKL